MSIVIGLSSVLKAFDAACVGSKVTDHQGFVDAITPAIMEHDFAKGTVPGQALIKAQAALPFVSPGVGRRTKNPDDYILREWRGRVDAYLLRDFAPPAEFCSIVVYTIDAYKKDPDDRDQAELKKFADNGVTHVLIAVLAGAGVEEPPFTPYRLVSNLAGGNREALKWKADEIRKKAKEAISYDDEWAVVADPLDEALSANPDIRVRQANLEQALAALHDAGYEAESVEPRGGSVSFLRGRMAGIRTTASGRQAHKILVEAGLVDCQMQHHGH